MRSAFLFALCLVVLGCSKLAKVGEWTALAHVANKRPITFPVSEPSINSDKNPTPVVESGMVTLRKLAIEGVLELCGVMVCFVLMSTKAMKFCNPPSPGHISGFIAVMIIIKVVKSIMTGFRTFPHGVSYETSCSDLTFATGLQGVVQKLGIGDMLWAGFVVAAGITVIALHYPFCVAGNIGLPDDVFMAFTGLLIINLIHFVGTVAHMCVWGHHQIEEQQIT